MLMSVVEFLGSCMVLQFSLPKGCDRARFGFTVLELCSPFLSMLSLSAFEVGEIVAILGGGVTVASTDSAFCFLSFCS